MENSETREILKVTMNPDRSMSVYGNGQSQEIAAAIITSILEMSLIYGMPIDALLGAINDTVKETYSEFSAMYAGGEPKCNE